MPKAIEQMYDVEVIGEFEAMVDQLAGVDPQALSDPEAIVALHRCQAKLDATLTRAVGAFEASGAWGQDGARTAASWLAHRCHLPSATAGRRVRLSRGLRHLPATEAAWAAGELGDAQVAALCKARTPRTAAAMARDEAMLVEQAQRLRFSSFVRAMGYWSWRADPDGAEHDAEAQHEARRCHVSQSFQGAYVGDFLLDPVRGSVVADRLRAIENELFEADWAEARARLGEQVRAGDLSRTPAQRRADALVEMAIRAGTAPAGGRRPEPLFSVLVGYETFAGPLCELANGTMVTPGSLVDWMDTAWIERVVFDGPSRVIDVGVTRRLFAGATRRAVEVRDRECFHPTCDQREGCQVDHVEPYAAGGPTRQDNGRLACGFHNRRRNKRGPPNRE